MRTKKPKPQRRLHRLSGVRVKDSYGRIYRVAADGSWRREDGGGMTKAERKTAKRQRREARVEKP